MVTLPNITLDVDITKPGTFTGTTHAERYIHEEEVRIYNTKETILKGDIRKLKYIFPPSVFLDLQNSQGLMVGKTRREIIAHLQKTYCDEEERETEIIKQEALLKSPYDPAELPQTYFALLQHARMILVSLKETIPDRKLIREALSQFDQHVDLHPTVDEWKLKSQENKTWSAFKTHFTRAIITRNKRGGSLKDAGIINHVQAEIDNNKENTQAMVQVQLQQAQLIDTLSQELETLKTHQANFTSDRQPLQPRQANTQSDGATLKMLVDLLKNQGDKNQGDNKDRAIVQRNDLPDGERTKRRYQNNNYCSTCGFDVRHTSKTCQYKAKNPNHNDAATITNMLGGSKRNVFHYKK